MTDMRHMEYLESVVREDVSELRRKEGTYQGSWKRRGGVGAFMMMARKWDRIEGILQVWHDKNPEGPLEAPPYDVFAHVERDTSGEDGTVLAEIRDLRRYLILVEAEMMARGVISEEKSVATVKKKTGDDSSEPWVMTRAKIDGFGLPRDVRGNLFVDWAHEWSYLSPSVTNHTMLGIEMAMSSSSSGIALDLARIKENYRKVGSFHVLKIENAPAFRRSLWPVLRTELNHKELTDAQKWIEPLYAWMESETKYRVRPEFAAWTRGTP